MNLSVYARLIQQKTLSHRIDMYCVDHSKQGYIREKHQTYKIFMQRMYTRLNKQYGIDQKKFNEFVEQALTF